MYVQVDVLGRFQVTVDGRTMPKREWRRSRSAALIKLLALARGHRVHREEAMEALLADVPPESMGANLRKAVYFARKTLDTSEVIALEKDAVALAPGLELVIDAETFQARAMAALQTGDPEELEHAADLYGGELLPDDRYVDWTDEPRERLRQLYIRVLRAGRMFERLLELDPTDEEAQRAAMQAALGAGNRGEVIRRFHWLSEKLRVDLGVGPAAATIAIYEAAIEQESGTVPRITDRVRASLAWGIMNLHSGEFAKAEAIAREARLLAIEGGLAREMGEASALFGLVAHMQGKWQQLFRSEFMAWVNEAPAVVSSIFDGHLCLAEFCLCGPAGHHGIATQARELLSVAERAGSVPGRALATLILGEAELFAGRLDPAEELLGDARQLFEEAKAEAGRVIALQRLGEVAMERGRKHRASRIAQESMPMAEASWLAPHLLPRLQKLAIEGASNKTAAMEAIAQGDRWLAGQGMCQPCSMGLRVASAIALCEAGVPDQASKRLDEAERIAGMWNGGPWVAAVWEARGLHRRAQGNNEQATALLSEAARRYRELGRMRDAERCLDRIARG